jgi:hypothetical protein
MHVCLRVGCLQSPQASISRLRVRGVHNYSGEFEVLEQFTKANIGCTVGALVETNVSRT